MNSTFWQMYASIYDLVRFLPPYKQMLKDVEEAVDIADVHKVLDVGCGTGNFIQHMIKRGSQADYTGIDISQVMLDQAKKKNKGNNVKFIIADLNKEIQFNDKSFDRIVALNSLYAVKDTQFTISELMRLLKPGGKLVFVNPHAQAGFLSTYSKILNSGKGIEKVFLFFVTMPLFFFNLIIKMKASQQVYHFLSSDNWKKVVKTHSPKSIIVKPTYIESNLITVEK